MNHFPYRKIPEAGCSDRNSFSVCGKGQDGGELKRRYIGISVSVACDAVNGLGRVISYVARRVNWSRQACCSRGREVTDEMWGV
jgi:hypothetical protein